MHIFWFVHWGRSPFSQIHWCKCKILSLGIHISNGCLNNHILQPCWHDSRKVQTYQVVLVKILDDGPKVYKMQKIQTCLNKNNKLNDLILINY